MDPALSVGRKTQPERKSLDIVGGSRGGTAIGIRVYACVWTRRHECVQKAYSGVFSV